MSTDQHRWILGGGLASGKSKVREVLAWAGIVTIDADRVGHQVLERNGPAFPEVAARWPQVIERGQVNRSALASIVFQDQRDLTALESITHPYIFDTINAQVEDVDGPVVVEVPIFGNRLGDEWQRIIVDSRDEVRLRRAIGRGMSELDAKSRMAQQPSRSEWLAIADLVLPNHLDEAELVATVQRVVPLL